MHFRRLIPGLLLPVCFAFTGCGYVHVGRTPDAPAPVLGDEKLVRENADLRLEKKILQQELALTRAQGEALRLTIENRAADGDTSRRLADRLNETTKELAELRASYAQLQAERNPTLDPEDPRALKLRLAETEEKLAATLRNFTQLQNDVGQLKQAVIRARAENLTLSMQAKHAAAQNEQTLAALARLNVELLAEKDARSRAEDEGQLLRTELRQLNPNSSALAQQRTGSAPGTQILAPDAKPEPAAAAGSPTSATTTLTSAATPDKPLVIRAVDGASPKPAITLSAGNIGATLVTSARAGRSAPAATEGSGTRSHQVGGGDTLAKISTQYYGTASRWSDILAANRDVMADGNTLVIGRTLRIP